jgi:hypothetical protein
LQASGGINEFNLRFPWQQSIMIMMIFYLMLWDE